MAVVGEIDEAGIAEARSMIGVPLRRDRMRWVNSATPDAIRHFAWGIGDDNPLWTDEQYAGRTRWGQRLAPPCFLYAVDYTVVAPKLPGVQWIYAGTDWTWFDVVRSGDALDSTARLTDVSEKSGRTFARWVLQTGEVTYTIGDRVVAVAGTTCARTPRGDALSADTGSVEPDGDVPQDPLYTPEQLADIEEQVLAEHPRGAERLTWEDVAVGDVLRPVVKGPLSIVDVVAWYSATQGAEPYGGAHARAVRYRRRHHDWHVNPITGAPDAAGRGHLEASTGRDVGMGGAYDVGPQRISWAGQMLTDWMGDDGFLHRLNVVLRRPNLVGHTTWWRGEVTAKRAASGVAFVDIVLRAENHRGKVSATGEATVALPSQRYGDVRLPLTRDAA
jgi:acyl dehydratase